MRKLAYIIVALMALWGCTKPQPKIEVTSVSLDRSSTLMNRGETLQLSATVQPSDATDKTVTWASEDPSVATVSNGLVTAVGEGKTRITAKAGEITAACIVTVRVGVSRVVLNHTSLDLTKGDVVELTATVEPSDAKDYTINWVSSNKEVAKVSPLGVLTAVSSGTATITVTAGECEARCEVKVYTPVTGVALNRTQLTMLPGETFTLVASVLPSDASDKTVSWSTSAPEVVTVDQNGMVTALAEGTATITVTASGFSSSCTVTVEKSNTEGFGDEEGQW